MNGEFEDWSVQGAAEDQQRMEASFAEDRFRDEQEAAGIDADTEAYVREYDARQKAKDELVEELTELRKTYDPLRKQIEEKEEILLRLYGLDWEDAAQLKLEYYDYEHPGYPYGATEEQKQAQDMDNALGYDPVTIEGYSPAIPEPKLKLQEVQPPEDWRTRVIREAREATAAFVKEREAWQRRHGYFKKQPTSGAGIDPDSIPF